MTLLLYYYLHYNTIYYLKHDNNELGHVFEHIFLEIDRNCVGHSILYF